MTYHAIASHLLSSQNGLAALVDTTGSFSPVRLRDVLIYRLEAREQHEWYQQSGFVYERVAQSAGDRASLTETATSLLDRVKVMRVFDVAGVVEAVGEVNEMIERSKTVFPPTRDANSASEKREVGDSEEEESDQGKSPIDQEASNTDNGRIGMLIVDSIVNIFGSIMSGSHVQGQALLTSSMRSLTHLTRHNHLCTILINGVVGVKSSDQAGYRLPPEDNASIFASTMGKPALGRNFTHLIDTSIFLSVVPKTSRDATLAIGQGRDDFEKAVVVEVLTDRNGSREGRWASFEVVSGIKLVPFPR